MMAKKNVYISLANAIRTTKVGSLALAGHPLTMPSRWTCHIPASQKTKTTTPNLRSAACFQWLTFFGNMLEVVHSHAKPASTPSQSQAPTHHLHPNEGAHRKSPLKEEHP